MTSNNTTTNPLSFSYAYHRNAEFRRLKGNLTRLILSNESNPQILEEWEIIVMRDFFESSMSWLEKNREGLEWRMGLE